MPGHECLNHLVDKEKLVEIDTGIIEAPPDAEHPGNHFMINCLYHDDIGKLLPKSMLSTARADTLVILKEVLKQKLLDGIVSVCISFFVIIPPTNRRSRIYRYSIITDALCDDSISIDESYLRPSVHVIQSSQYREIENLLSRERNEMPV